MSITAGQVREALLLLQWSRLELSMKAKVGVGVIANIEAKKGILIEGALNRMRAALEAAGVEFVAENGGGAGVRLSKKATDQH